MTFRKNEPRCDEPSEMTGTEQRLFIMTKLSNPWWRLNHLYKIQNEKGELVTFRMRPAQRQLFRSMHNKNIILKARQLGVSTAIDIYLLDQALFIPHLKCGIVAQDKQAASEIFRTKIAVPFDHLPDWLRASFTIVERRSGASGGYILFGHGS
ncbi:TPA: terminase, partial [Shigella sonnei]